jgi:hypothetical protein
VAGGVLVAGLALAPPAEAGHGWSFGAGFRVDGVHFRVGFGPQGFGHYGAPFFVTSHRLGYRGYACHGGCFRRGGSFYHHAACPVVGFHFHRGGHYVGHYLQRFSPYPAYRGYRGYRGDYRPWGVWGYREPYPRYRPYDRYRGAPRYYQHDYWRRYRDWDHDSDSDSDSDSDRRRRRRRGRRH